MIDALAEAIRECSENGQRSDAKEQRGIDEALDEARATPACVAVITGAAYPGLQPSTQVLHAFLDAQQGADYATHNDGPEHDEKGGRRADVGDPLHVCQSDDVEGGHDEDHQTERLGDEIAGALREASAHEYAERRAHDDRRHIEQSPEADHRARLATISSTACWGPPAVTRH